MKAKNIITTVALAAMLLTPQISDAAKPEKARNAKEQCVAITTKNARCKLKVEKGSKYCLVHQANNKKTAQCKATTKNGKRCQRAATKKGYCTQHAKMKK